MRRSKIFFIVGTIFGLFFVFAIKSFAELYYDYQILQALSFQQVSIGLPSKAFADNIKDGVTLHAGDSKFYISQSTLNDWFEKFTRSYTFQEEVRPKTDNISQYLVQIADAVAINPKNARIGQSPTHPEEIIELEPSVIGKRLNKEESIKRIISSLKNGDKDIDIVLEQIEPEISLKNLYKMGIYTMISKGESNFVGSPTFRVHNITVGSKIFDSFIIQPEETFSFNNKLGPVDGEHGYKPELIIKGKKLVRDYGGGICQVSTTLFRAAMYAGLPILERQSHSLPVRYYSPQGFDAAIYPGVVDLKFKNDTKAPIFVQATIDGTKISFEMFGQKDGRKVVLNKPITLSADPDGALKTLLTRSVTKAGDTKPRVDNYFSNYRSPKSVEVPRNPLE